MPRLSLDGFRDPARRPRFIIWTVVGVMVLAAVMVVALGVTSTRWFCSEGCHKVQDDTIMAYERSSHSNISCMACHMPPGATPVTFLLHKMEALGELYLTVTNQYELPLNGESHVSLTMPSAQCTQCHNLEKRPVTPTGGILIDHDAHGTKEVSCAICHNRVAHREDFELTLKDPETNKVNRKHDDFMSMTACFRCHTQEAKSSGLQAPGACSACHPANFDLKPASHKQEGFYPAGHAKLAHEEESRVAAAESTHAGAEGGKGGEGEGGKVVPAVAKEGGSHGGGGVGESLPKVGSINECRTCHAEKFCSDCHGLPMPHPADFKKGHGDLGKKQPKSCVKCHGNADRFCDECHHGTALEYAYQTDRPWTPQHPVAVAQMGANACFDCHPPTYCAACHVRGSSSSD